MALTLASPISTARTILNDPDAVRYSAADLLAYANDALDVLATLVPQLFYTQGTHTCVAGVSQVVAESTAVALVDVRRIQSGNALTRTDPAVLDLYDPTWRSATAAAAAQWAHDGDDPRRFLVYPPSAANQVLEITYVAVPSEYASGADTGLPMALSDAISDYIVARAESRDAEHVVSGRASQFMASFMAKVKGA